MWLSKGIEYAHTATYQKRGSIFIDREFQIRYSSIVLAAGALGTIINLIPIYFFLEQNYRIFYDLAFNNMPDIINQLSRERLLMRIFSAGSFLSMILFFAFFSFRMTSRIVGPLKVMRNHLKQITRGNWRLHPIKVRENDEFQDLIDSYNYFYSSYRAMLQRDLNYLKSFNIDPNDKEAHSSWVQMIEEKASQLYQPKDFPLPSPIPLNGANSSAIHDSRRAS